MTDLAIGYTRLSQQSDTSIERQRDHIETYAAEHDFQLDEVYSDGQGASGFDREARQEYQAVVERVRSGGPDAVVVNDKRRLTRDVDEAMRLLPDFRENGVELHTYQDGPLDLSDPIRAAIEIVSAAAAYEEKQQEIEKAREATQERVDDPDVDHGRPRFGMTYNEAGTKQVPGEDFDVVLDILRRDNRGETLPQIADVHDMPTSTVYRVLERREWYVSRSQEIET